MEAATIVIDSTLFQRTPVWAQQQERERAAATVQIHASLERARGLTPAALFGDVRPAAY